MHYHCYDNNNHGINTMIITSGWWWRTPRTCLSFCCPGFLMEIIVGKKKSSWDSEKVENRSTIKTKHKTWEEEQILFFPNNAGFLYGNHSVEKEIKLWLWKYRNISTIKKKYFSWKKKQWLLFPNYAGYISLMIAFWTVLAGPMGDQLALFCQIVSLR